MKQFVKGRIKSFGSAFNGLGLVVKNDVNARIHLLGAVVALSLSYWFHISRMEWGLVVLAIFLVFICEAMNTTIEKVCDFVHPEYSTKIKFIKDVAAGVALLGAGAAFIIGVIVFVPYISSTFS